MLEMYNQEFQNKSDIEPEFNDTFVVDGLRSSEDLMNDNKKSLQKYKS